MAELSRPQAVDSDGWLSCALVVARQGGWQRLAPVCGVTVEGAVEGSGVRWRAWRMAVRFGQRGHGLRGRVEREYQGEAQALKYFKIFSGLSHFCRLKRKKPAEVKLKKPTKIICYF